MTASWILAVVLLAGATSASSIASRIVGGAETTIQNYPSLVQVDSLSVFSGTWVQSCAGNVLNSRYILSSARCFDGMNYNPESRRIRAGTTERNVGGVVAYVEKENNHPDYGRLGMDSDITVVALQTALIFSSTIQQGAIVSSGTDLPDHLPVVIAGWGATSHGGLPSNVLREATLYKVNNEVCQQRYVNSPVTENMICAGDFEVGGTGACQGDFGGGVYYDNIIIGVMSWGQGCAHSDFPGVSTKVTSYTDWILATAV